MNSTPRRRRNPRSMNPTRPRRPRVKLNRAAVSGLLSLLHMTQTELAQLCGLDPGYFSLLMAGKRSPSPEARRRIQQALGVSDFDRLFFMEPAAEEGPDTETPSP